VATDIDGVWTDAKMYYTKDGDYMKAFSTYDGMGASELMKANYTVMIMTSENTEIVKQRAEKLGIDLVFQGGGEKLDKLQKVCDEMGITLDNVAYIGDDLNDLNVLKNVGLSAMPPNSPILNIISPDFITTRSGGNGAFRDLADLILSQK
jgi:3-deoxy-D-manno-octulosonate 8-phosphate phosphatase (KDO 8-P phosphatase)